MEESFQVFTGGAMILGFSDATIAVVKRGPEEVKEQGLLADHIGMSVCPRILRFVPDGYEMELLEPPHSRNSMMLMTVLGRLTHHVWPRRSYRTQGADLRDDSGWLIPLQRWALDHDCSWLHEAISCVYPMEPVDGYCLIHGDPTLANLMQRSNGELIITDPMPRMAYRREIPNRMEVDLGKLVQSAVGWERVLGCDSSMWEEVHHVRQFLPDHLAVKAELWGAIHLARVAVRAPGKGRHKIGSWAKTISQALTRNVLREFA